MKTPIALDAGGTTEMRVRFEVKTLWQGDKGKTPCPFEYTPIAPRGLDGYGVWFVHAEDSTLWVANANHHCLIHTYGRTEKTLKNPFAPEFRMAGGCFHAGALTVLMRRARGRQPDKIVRLSSSGRWSSVLTLSESVEVASPTWFRFYPARNSWLCTFPNIMFDGTVSRVNLFEYSSQTGERLRVIENITGVALTPSGRLYVSGVGAAPSDAVPVAPPSELDSSRWLLVGADRWERLYWYSQERAGRWNVSHLACSDSQRRILWQSPLTGDQGILAVIDPRLQVRLGWGCEWLEVSASGAVEVFAWSGSEKVNGGVGVYQVRWHGGD